MLPLLGEVNIASRSFYPLKENNNEMGRSPYDITTPVRFYPAA